MAPMTRLGAFVLGASLACAAQAQTPPGGHVPPQGFDPALFKPLPDRRDVVSWRLLAQVELVKQKDRYVAQFSDGVAALNRKEVKLQGFMMPLQMGDKQSHFVLSAMPQSCAFCMPGGPESLVEVKAKHPIAYGFEPIVVSGRLEVLKDDPTGVFYRLIEAVLAK
jgi:hypothetical protein